MFRVPDTQPTEASIQALKTDIEFLLNVAEGDTCQSGRLRNFLLVWWNAEDCGGFDLTDLWNLHMKIVEAIQRILFALPNYHFYPDRLGYAERFERLARERIAAETGGNPMSRTMGSQTESQREKTKQESPTVRMMRDRLSNSGIWKILLLYARSTGIRELTLHDLRRTARSCALR